MTNTERMNSIRRYHFQMNVFETQEKLGIDDLTMDQFRKCWSEANLAAAKWHLRQLSKVETIQPDLRRSEH